MTFRRGERRTIIFKNIYSLRPTWIWGNLAKLNMHTIQEAIILKTRTTSRLPGMLHTLNDSTMTKYSYRKTPRYSLVFFIRLMRFTSPLHYGHYWLLAFNRRERPSYTSIHCKRLLSLRKFNASRSYEYGVIDRLWNHKMDRLTKV